MTDRSKTQTWQKWDGTNTPPVEGAFLTERGWEIHLEGSDPSKGLTELLVALSASGVVAAGSANIINIILPAAGTYVVDDVLSFTVIFNEQVTVTGTPRLTLDVGGDTLYATYASGTGTNELVFEATVVDTNIDLDGVELANDIGLNSGTIVDVVDEENTALTFTGADYDLSEVLVDALDRVVSSLAADVGDYLTGQDIEVVATFNNVVLVDTTEGVPSIPLFLNDGTTPIGDAVYDSGSGTDELIFVYTVLNTDSAPTSIKAGADIELNDGLITDTVGTAVDETVSQTTLTNVTIRIAPTVSTVAAPAATYTTAQNIPVTATFDRAVTVTGTPRIPMFANDGTTPLTNTYATYVSGSGTTDLVFNYLVDASDINATAVKAGADISLNGGTIKRTGDTSLNATLTFAQATLTGVLTN